MLAQAAHKLGHDVTFILNLDMPLHKPENRYPDIRAAYPEWIVDLAPMVYADYLSNTPKRQHAVELLKNCDFVVLNHLGPALAKFIKRPAVALLTGSDLDYYADYNKIPAFWFPEGSLPPMWPKLPSDAAKQLMSQQREGIHKSFAVSYFHPGIMPHGDMLLKEIGVLTPKRLCCYMADIEQCHYRPEQLHTPLRILIGARLNWADTGLLDLSPLDYKGIDTMLRGIALFLDTCKQSVEIHMFNKGRHVAETEQLLAGLKLANFVHWLPEMTQTEFRERLYKADVVFDQTADSAVGMVGFDAMAIGRPVIANGKPEVFRNLPGGVLPLCQAKSAEEISNELTRLVTEAGYHQTLVESARRYSETFCDPLKYANELIRRFSR